MTKALPQSLPVWDLSDLYSSKDCAEYKNDSKYSHELALSFAEKYTKKINSISGAELLCAIKSYEVIEEKLGRMASFAYLLYSQNMSDEQNSAFYQNNYENINDISTKLLFFTLEIAQLDDKNIAEKYNSCQELKDYEPWIRDVRAFKPYQLSDELEKILHEKNVTGAQSWNRLFDEVIADLRFPFRNEELSCAEIFNKMSSKNANDRKDAAFSIGKIFKENIKIFAMITNVLAKDKSIEDGYRGFKKPISSRNLSNYIEDEVVEALISSVKNSYPALSHRYYKAKAKLFGVESLDYWDRNAPLPEDSAEEISWESAKEIVLTSYNSFSPKLADLGKKFFDNNWIDVPPRQGKDSGAYAHPTVTTTHPYLLLNFQGKTRDVMTLAHELGHGVHQLLSAKKGELMSDTPLTLAETASVFGEQLTFREILRREKNVKKRKIIIANKVEDMLNTVIRQIAFCEFERLIHDERKKGEIPVERINELWMQVQSESLGEAINLHDEYKYYWSYIPHFIHSPFYVYSYAFGDCLVNALYARYLEGVENFEEKYFDMLKAGGTLRHKELLAPFGLDASDPNFWQKGLDIIAGFIDELE